MKAYTDISKSKKLAEILPIESADMCYDWFVIGKEYSNIPQCRKFIDDELPCWSLTALLELIPNWTMDKTDKINLTCNPYYHCETCYEDPLDAAFEMTVWLKESGKI